jgi:hypothetical protein
MTMRARISTVLLLGAMTMAGSLAAQTVPARTKSRPRFDTAFTWDGAHAQIAGGGSFWMNGAGFQLHVPFWRGLGVVADIAGTGTSDMGSTGVGLDLITVDFGPRYTWSRRRMSFYAQGLAGQAFGFNGLFPAPRAANSSDDSLAALAGGGIDASLRPHLALRLVEADWLRTQLPNSAANVQNDLRLSAGIVLRFH